MLVITDHYFLHHRQNGRYISRHAHLVASFYDSQQQSIALSWQVLLENDRNWVHNLCCSGWYSLSHNSFYPSLDLCHSKWRPEATWHQPHNLYTCSCGWRRRDSFFGIGSVIKFWYFSDTDLNSATLGSLSLGHIRRKCVWSSGASSHILHSRSLYGVFGQVHAGTKQPARIYRSFGDPDSYKGWKWKNGWRHPWITPCMIVDYRVLCGWPLYFGIYLWASLLNYGS